MNFDDYRALPAMNWSKLKDGNVSPKLWKWREAHPRPDSPALSTGRLIHLGVLEPERFAAECVERPPGLDLRRKEGKAWEAEVVAAGQSVVDATVVRCVEAVRADPEASALLADCETEQTVEWVDQATGVACKARLDAAKPGLIVDLKSCRSLAGFADFDSDSPRKLDAEKNLYHGQLAWYLSGAVAAEAVEHGSEAYLIAVETCEPYDVAVVRASECTLDKGRALCRQLLGLWQQCSKADLWPGISPATTEWNLSPYAAGTYSKVEHI